MFFKKKKVKKKADISHWLLGWSGELELGFDDGTYLPRKAALILNPEYFDENGNPRVEMLPVGKK